MLDNPFVYQGWLHPGSWLSSKVIIPIDTAFGSTTIENITNFGDIYLSIFKLADDSSIC